MSINVHMTVRGGNLPKLWKQKVTEVHNAIQADLTEEAVAIVQIMQDNYDTVPPGTTYIRTYNLQNSWKIIPTTLGGQVNLNIRNNATEQPSSFTNKKTGKTYVRKKVKGRLYAGFVQGPIEGSTGQGQWSAHRARGWLSVDDVLLSRQSARRLAEKMQRRLRITV